MASSFSETLKVSPVPFREGEPSDPSNRQAAYGGGATPAYQENIRHQAREFSADILFDRRDNLEVFASEGVEAQGYLSRFWKLRNDQSLLVGYSVKGDNLPKILEFRFKKSPVIAHPFNSIRLWCGRTYGRNMETGTLVVDLADAEGKTQTISLGTINGWGFGLITSNRISVPLKLPVKVMALRHIDLVQKTCDLVLDSMEFVQDPRFGGEFAVREINPSDLMYGGETGRILKAKDFPIPEVNFKKEGCVPVSETSRLVKTQLVCKDAEAVFELSDGTTQIKYRVLPRDGTFSDITCSANGEPWFRPCMGGGLFTDQRQSPSGSPYYNIRTADGGYSLVETSRVGDAFLTRWRHKDNPRAAFQLTYSIVNRSLVVDIETENPGWGGVALGGVENVRPGDTFPVPFWLMQDSIPRMTLVGQHFLSIFFDWTRTHSSGLFAIEGLENESTAINGPALYLPKTDGTRNRVSERLYITLAPKFEDVLPSIPNPVARHAESLKGVVMSTRSGCWPMIPNPEKVELNGWKRLHRLGIRKVMIRYHCDLHRSLDSDEDCMVDNVTTIYGLTNEKWKTTVAEMKQLGYLVGPYQNYNLTHPNNRTFRGSCVILNPEGKWVADDSFNYWIMKPGVAVRWESIFMPHVKNKFGYNMVYYDQTTTRGPGGCYTDYDARMPGAADSGATLRCHLAFLQNASRVVGPVISEGQRHFMYAGFTDGSYNQCVEPDGPPLVDFILRKIHPLETDFGYFLGWAGVDSYTDPDQWLAGEVVYGANGHLHGGGGTMWNANLSEIKMHLVARSYFMIQQLAKRYALQPVRKIEYFKRNTAYDSSQALRDNVYRTGCVHTVYANGCETWVNFNAQKRWSVETPMGTLQLPPYGYAGWMKDELAVYSAEEDGRRVDFVKSPEYVYADGRGKPKDFGVIRTTGPVVIFREGNGYRLAPVPIENDGVVAQTLQVNLRDLFPQVEKVTVSKLDNNDTSVSRSEAETRRPLELSINANDQNVLFELTP